MAEMKLNNVLYQGSFVNGLRSGLGRIKYANGNLFYGIFEQNEINGMGIMIYRNGNVAFGKFKNGKKHGTCYLYDKLQKDDTVQKTL